MKNLKCFRIKSIYGRKITVLKYWGWGGYGRMKNDINTLEILIIACILEANTE